MDFSGLFVRRKLLVIISIILLLLAIPLGTFLVQRQTQLKSRADSGETFGCSENEANNGSKSESCSGTKDGLDCQGHKFSEFAGKCLSEDGSQKNCEEGDVKFLCKWSECKFEPGEYTCEDPEVPPIPPPPVVTLNTCDPGCDATSDKPYCNPASVTCEICTSVNHCPTGRICDVREGSVDNGKCVTSIGAPRSSPSASNPTRSSNPTAPQRSVTPQQSSNPTAQPRTQPSTQPSTAPSASPAAAAVKPTTPTGLYGHCSGAQASVFWNSSQNATSYNLKIDNNASSWKGTSVYFGGASGTSYQLSVQAVNGNQTSDYSAAITITCR